MADTRPATTDEQEQCYRLYAQLQAKRGEVQAAEQAWYQFCLQHEGVLFSGTKRPQGAINA